MHLYVNLDADAFICRIASAADLKFLRYCGEVVQELQIQSRTGIMTLQCPFDSEVRIKGRPQMFANFGIGTLPMPERQPSEAVIRAWARLIRAQQAALSAVESDLKAAGFPPLAWYDVLLELSRVGDAGLRPFALEREVLLTQYNLSRLLDRLEQAGHVERRGQIVAVTASGRALVKRMWPTYRAAIARHVGTKLSEDETARLATLLGKLTGG
jgi:DNA-binding MarR family transcriptional regulator